MIVVSAGWAMTIVARWSKPCSTQDPRRARRRVKLCAKKRNKVGVLVLDDERDGTYRITFEN